MESIHFIQLQTCLVFVECSRICASLGIFQVTNVTFRLCSSFFLFLTCRLPNIFSLYLIEAEQPWTEVVRELSYESMSICILWQRAVCTSADKICRPTRVHTWSDFVFDLHQWLAQLFTSVKDPTLCGRCCPFPTNSCVSCLLTTLTFSMPIKTFKFSMPIKTFNSSVFKKTLEFIAELSRTRSARIGAPWVTKIGKLSIRENLVMT